MEINGRSVGPLSPPPMVSLGAEAPAAPPPVPSLPGDAFSLASRAVESAAPASRSADDSLRPYAALFVEGFPERFRPAFEQALDALPPAVPRALEQAGLRFAVVQANPDAPPPFHFEPYRLDSLLEAAPAIAGLSPKDHRRLEFGGARVFSERSDPYMTFDDLARQRGASSPREVSEMARVAARLNPGATGPDGTLPPGRMIFIPDYYYWRGQRVPTAAWNALTQEEQGIAGTTFDKGIPGTDAPKKFILMSAMAFGEAPALATFYLHHEIGHAVVDILSMQEPGFHKELLGEMGERMEADRQARTLLRPYSGSEPDEFIADAFASRFLAPPDDRSTPAGQQQAALCGETLHERDPRAHELAGEMIDHLGKPAS